MIRKIPRVVPAPPGKPAREGAAESQQRARRLALQPGTWDRQEAAAMMAGYLPTEVLVAAMAAVTGRAWGAIESQAHWGSWSVLRPASPA